MLVPVSCEAQSNLIEGCIYQEKRTSLMIALLFKVHSRDASLLPSSVMGLTGVWCRSWSSSAWTPSPNHPFWICCTRGTRKEILIDSVLTKCRRSQRSYMWWRIDKLSCRFSRPCLDCQAASRLLRNTTARLLLILINLSLQFHACAAHLSNYLS
jgi:hypothetical protein